MSWTQFDPNNKYTNSGFEVRYCEQVAPSLGISFSPNFSYISANYCEQSAPSFDIGVTKFQLQGLVTFCDELSTTLISNSSNFYSQISKFQSIMVAFCENAIEPPLNTLNYLQATKFEDKKQVAFCEMSSIVII